MLERILSKNRNSFLRYNRFRKSVFTELSPADSDAILYLLPWLLSVNHPACPGYVPEMKRRIKVYNIDNEQDIRKREPSFKRMFGIEGRESSYSLLKSRPDFLLIQGIYTIGSVGTVGQTPDSDCDIWICYDKGDFNESEWRQLNQKLNLIKDWMDQHLKLPVFFFVSDITDICESRFGSVDAESSGSAQKNVLKEEFYRTCMVICGKIPLWWICYHPETDLDYAEVLATTENSLFSLYDVIDLGNVTAVQPSEYFGAALWQLHKSLKQSLKSIIKMALLEMQLEAGGEELICHQLRAMVLSDEPTNGFQDPMVFTMRAIIEHYRRKGQRDRIDFLMRCFYLRCQLRPYDKRDALKKQITENLLKDYPIDIKERIHLSRFQTWTFDKQVELGDQLFKFLIRMYKDISSRHSGIATEIDKEDSTVLGRKIIVTYQNKPDKIPVLQKPTGSLNLSSLTFVLEGGNWNVYSGGDTSLLMVSNSDVIFDIAFLVWNDLFDTTRIRMEPNPSSVTLQEIINLGKRMTTLFGVSNIPEIPFSSFLKKTVITEMLVVISFENSPWEKDIHNFAVVYKTSWGELFVKRFQSTGKLLSFLKRAPVEAGYLEPSLYIERQSTAYEKIIERTKKIISVLPWIAGQGADGD